MLLKELPGTLIPALLMIVLAQSPAMGQGAAEAYSLIPKVSKTGAAPSPGSAAAEKLQGDSSAKEGTADGGDDAARRSHLRLRSRDESLEETNRKLLEADAGDEPGTLLVRSKPTGSKVWVQGKIMGETPLLLMVAPGEYTVEIRGKRMEYATAEVDLLPDETRELLLELEQRYPSTVRLP